MTAEFLPVTDSDGQLVDITARINGRSFAMLGAAGPQRELALVQDFLKEKAGLPVFLGAGIGHGLREILSRYAGPIAIVDAENDLRQLALIPQAPDSPDRERITLISDKNPDTVLALLTQWQNLHGGKPLVPIVNTFYQRINPEYYGELRKSIAASAAYNFWSKARLPRFQGENPRVLLLASKYFLIGELERACARLNVPHRLLRIGEDAVDTRDFVKNFLQEAVTFRPDCCITLNHMGVDMEGVLMELLARLELPLASWFVDNPHLIIHLYARSVSPWAAIFTWDEDNIPTLRSAGYAHVAYLPLGTDPERFRPHVGKPNPNWDARVSFVGNSMLYKVGSRLKTMRFKAPLLRPLQTVARAFAASEDRSVADFLQKQFPQVFSEFEKLPDTDARLAYETAITWKATQIYRNERVAELIPFRPLIVGDRAWRTVFRHAEPKPRFLDAISYYSQLPVFYGQSEINFNCTSRQMKGAVNQRVFDAPAAGGFVLTDWRPQMEALFSPDEMACYHDLAEIPDLVRYFLDNPDQRQKITANARKRILACHTWTNRLETMLGAMRAIYGTPKVK